MYCNLCWSQTKTKHSENTALGAPVLHWWSTGSRRRTHCKKASRFVGREMAGSKGVYIYYKMCEKAWPWLDSYDTKVLPVSLSCKQKEEVSTVSFKNPREGYLWQRNLDRQMLCAAWPPQSFVFSKNEGAKKAETKAKAPTKSAHRGWHHQPWYNSDCYF